MGKVPVHIVSELVVAGTGWIAPDPAHPMRHSALARCPAACAGWQSGTAPAAGCTACGLSTRSTARAQGARAVRRSLRSNPAGHL